jgi:hypothetical protein
VWTFNHLPNGVLDVQPVAGAVAEALLEADAAESALRRVRQAITGGRPPSMHGVTRS